MEEKSLTIEGCAERTGEGKPGQADGEANAATKITATSSEEPSCGTKAVPETTVSCNKESVTMNRSPAQKDVEAEQDEAEASEAKDPPPSSSAFSDPGVARSVITNDILKTTKDCALPDKDVDSCKESTSAKLHFPGEATQGDEDTPQGLSVELEKSRQLSDTLQSANDLVYTHAELGLPTKLSVGKVQTAEDTDKTTSEEITTSCTKDESSCIKDTSSIQCTRDQSDSHHDASEQPESDMSSITSSNQSAKTTFLPEVTSQGQCNKQDPVQTLPASSNTSLPSQKPMQIDSNCSTKVEDTANNNVQKCTTSCQEPQGGLKEVQCEAIASPEKPASPDQSSCATVQVQMVVDEPLSVMGTVESVDGNQNRSLLMKYLGLQPVQEGGKKCNKDGRVKNAPSKPRLGNAYLDSFGLMPGLDLMNPYDKGHISFNTSPFEVCSDGSHSPEPPLLAETPVVGSSPPHHDYDAMEARMMDMTPRVDSGMGRGDLLSSFPHSHPPTQDTKMTFNRKQQGASGYTSSHALDSLCHRLAERVEPDIPDQDHTLSQGTKLSDSIYSIPDKKQEDCDTYGSKTKKFSSTSEVVPCPRCHRTFKNRNQLRGHLRWHINDPINLLSGRWPKGNSSSHEKDPTPAKRSGKVLDKFGPGRKKTKSKAHLDTEQRGSSLDAFPCTLCPKVFRTPLKLRGHMMVHKRKHPKKKNIYWRNKTNKGSSKRVGKFQCEICPEKFDSQLKLSTHITIHAKEVHPRSKGVKRLGSLEISSVGSGRGGILNMRQKSLLGKRKAPFQCDICFKTFLTSRACNGHKGIHSSKWKLANSLNHLGRPVKIKEEPCAVSPTTDEQFSSETKGKGSDQPDPNKGDEMEQMREAEEDPDESLSESHRMRMTYFKCISCHLVFASRHRVRKHLFKVHSIMPPALDSFTEEKIDGCKFCEVFKKRKRGRPKRGENTLVQCPHGKIVVGYNLPGNSFRPGRKIRCTPKRVKTEEIAAVSPEDVLQQKCIVKLSPVDVDVAQEKKDFSKDNSNDQVQTSEDIKMQDTPIVKKRGRPPKNCLKPANTRKMVFSVGAHSSRRGGTRALSAIRRRRMGKELSILGRQLKSGWDPKRQRFIGRPYKCHLCKMSYRSERQLCSHMRSHGIHIFDLSQLPADQRGNAFMSREDMETKSDNGQDLDTPQGVVSGSILDGITATSSTVPDLERASGESGVGGTCAVCKKEFDSDNMFHQHLLGRYNKKCRQEWMSHTFGFGMRNKVKDAPEQDFKDEPNPVDLQKDSNCLPSNDEQSNGNLYVIDKINMESLQGSGIFSNLQQKVNDKIENVLQREKLAKNCSRSLDNTEAQDTEQPSVSCQSNAGLGTNVTQKKGSVLDAVINRLTQSSKPSNDIQSTTPTPSQSGKAGKKPRKGSDKPAFRCRTCNKTFDRKQKLSVHAMIHRPKVATVMDHVEIATQRSGSGISTLPSEELKQQSLQGQVINDCLSTTAPDTLTPMHLIYTCTECPKQFTSNLKLASHLKMHMKSTMSRSPKRDSKVGCIPQDGKGEQVLDSNKTDVSTIPMEISTAPVLETDINQDNTQNEGMPSAVQNDIPVEDELTNHVNACDSTDPTSSDITLKPGENVSEVPKEQDVNKDEEKSHTESEQITTNRPRLLLKINPTTLQRLYDCKECSKSFKSRRQLAHHQKICHEGKVSHECLEGNKRQQSDSCTTPSTESEKSRPDFTEVASHSYESEEKTASVEPCAQDPDQLSVGAVYPEPKQANLNIDNNPVQAKRSKKSDQPEKIVPCKICDKVMKKSQLGGHMRCHTKELLSRKFTRPDHGKSIMNREIISGVDLYRSVSRKAESTFEYPSSEAVNGIAATASGELAGDAGPGVRDLYDYEEEIQDEDAGKFTCRICNTKYDYYQQLCQHLKMHVVKNPNFSETATPSDIDEASLMDKIDDEQAPDMENGTPTFARPKVYPCELCGFSFSSFRQFRVHISQTHGGKYQYRLMIQQKEAAKAGAFLKEPDTINKTHPHKCDVCGRRFKRLALLIFHLNKLHKGWKQRLCMMNVRSRPRPPHTAVQKMPGTTNGPSVPGTPGVDPTDLPFTCELCGKSFKMKVQLCGHMKTHGRVGHSPIKITPLAMKGKYTLRKSRKPDFRLSDEWILDMDDERMAFENSMALQQLPQGPTMMEQPNKMNGSPDPSMYASMYAAKPIASNIGGTQKNIPGLAKHSDKYRMPMSSPELPMTAPALDLKIPVAPPPPEPSKFITIQMEPVLQQMLHRCLLCHSYFSSQESAVQHCKEVHFKKRLKTPADAVYSPALPQGQNYQMIGATSGVRQHSALHSSPVPPVRPQMSPSLRPPAPQRMHCPPSMVSQVSPGVRSPTSQAVPRIQSPGFDRASIPPIRFPVGSSHSPVLPYAETMPKAAPTPSPSAKTISQTPFNEMLYRVETSEGQTRYVCNTCKSTFLHYNFLMSHLADHNHLAYTCLQCGYATYSEKDYQLHCQLHDGQISKKIRRVRPKPPGFASNSDEKAPRAVATCHICQRSFVNMKGLKAHMVLHSANYNSISERRNENKKVQRRSIMVPVTCFNEVPSEPLSLVKPTEEQTEALDLTVKPVVDTSVDEVLDLSMGPRSFADRVESPLLDESLDMTIKNIPEENQLLSLPDVCQVVQQTDNSEEPTSSPTPPPSEKLTHVRKPKNSIRLVGAIDVDVSSLENKYSVVTDLMDTDSDISPDVPLLPGEDSPLRSTEGETEHDGKSPKKARNYKCTMCQYATDFRESMDRHEMKHRKFRTLACHQCSYRTPEKRLMLRHVLTIHEKQKPYECKLCSYSSAYKHHLKRHHTKRHQQPLLTCSLCEFTSDDVVKMKEHSASHPSPKVYQCKLCPMKFNNSKLLKAHKHIVHHKKKKKSKKSSHDKHHSSSGITDSSESAGGKEKESVTNPEEPQEPVVLKHPCNLCKYQTDDHNELTIHLMKNHFSSQIKEGLGDVCSTAQCPQCGYLTGKEQMKAHMQIHDSGELFNCDQCLFKACSQEEVDEHVQQKHKVKLAPTQMCKMCGMHFWNAEDMKQHTEIHLKDTSISVKNPFLCNMCPLKLMNRRDALRHLQLHTDRYPFKCRHCVFSCFTKASIQRHLAIHRHSNSKPKSLTAIKKNGRKSHSMGASASSGSESDAQKKTSQSTTC